MIRRQVHNTTTTKYLLACLSDCGRSNQHTLRASGMFATGRSAKCWPVPYFTCVQILAAWSLGKLTNSLVEVPRVAGFSGGEKGYELTPSRTNTQ